MLLMTTLVSMTLGAQAPPSVDAFLRERLGFSERDVRETASGAVIVKKLDGATDEEIALIGVMRLPISARSAIERLGDPMAWRQNVSQGGRFSPAPVAGDLAAFRVPSDDRDLLQSCRVGKCVLKLPSSVIDSLRRVDWRTPAADTLAAALWRSWLLDYVRGYVERGNAALVVYSDRETPLPLHTGFHALLQQSPYLFAYVPVFHHYLEEFPARTLPGAVDALYWSTEDVGLRPITTVTHATVYRPDSVTGIAALLALKQIYASHYFHAALALITVIDDPTPEGPGAYVIYLERSLFDTRLGGIVRRSAEGRLRGDLRARLAAMQRQWR